MHKKLIFLFIALVCSAILHAQDRDVLMALYNATDGPNWTDNTNWGSAMPIDTWFGITTNTAGDVTSIDLINNNLIGVLPNEIGNLAAIEIINITQNANLEGPIPPEIGTLISLTNFNLFANGITGEIPELGNLANLTSLSLSGNNITGEIPVSLGNLINLTSLQLGNNQLTGAIPISVGALVNLRSLSLGQNNLVGGIPEEIGNLDALGTFTIDRNPNLGGGIPDSFVNLTQMEIFWASDCNLTGTLPPLPWNNLTSLDISGNELEGEIPNFIFTGVAGNGSSLRINGNRFQFGDFEDEFVYYSSLTAFVNNPQAAVNEAQNITACAGAPITLTTTVSGNANIYQWFRSGLPIPQSNTPDLVIANPQYIDAGVYTCTITSTIVTDLTLEREPIMLTVSETGPSANPIDDIFACGTNGFASFDIDLASIEAQVLNGQTGLAVSFFDAMGNPLPLTDTFTNTVAQQQDITVRVESSINCFNETIFSLIVIDTIVADALPNSSECRYTLPQLNVNNSYFSEPNRGGDQLNAGDIITTTQTIYINAEIGSGANLCSDETSFTITIDSAPCEPDTIVGLPKFFTPNGDGVNDLWDVSVLEGENDATVFIFDRHGNLLQQLNPNEGIGWNGTFNGNPLPSSDYWFKYVEENTGKTISGHFTLKR